MLMNDALLLVVVIFVLLFLAMRVKSLQICFRKDAGQNVRTDGNQNHEKERVKVPHRCKVGHNEDRKGTNQLNQGEELNRSPLHIGNDRNGRALLGNHEAKDCALPNFIPVQSANAKIQEQTEESATWDPANDTEGRESNKHQKGLAETGPSLLFDVRNHLPLHSVFVRFNLASAQSSDMKRSLWDETIARRQAKDGTGNEGDTKHEEIPMIRCGLLQVVFGHLTQNARYVVIDDEQQEEHETGNDGTKDCRR